MSYSIPVLWPSDISVEVATPLAILRAQAEPLKEMTRGYLSVDIHTVSDSSSAEVVHMMDLVAAPLDNYRCTLLTVSHDRNQVYPASIESIGLQPIIKDDSVRKFDQVAKSLTRYKGRRTSDEREFIQALKEILTAPPVRSMISSLLAKINEEFTSKQPAESTS
jgi:hypothetical protein